MGYWEAKYHLLGGWRILCLVLNVFIFLNGFWVLYQIGFFTRDWYNEDKAFVCFFVILTSLLSFIQINRPVILNKTEDEKHSLISLWWKYKKLEHLAKIKELEK